MLPLPFPASSISLAYGAVDGVFYTTTSPHQGTDLSSRSQGVVAGTIILASGPGVVIRSGYGPQGVTPNITRPNALAGNSIDVDYGACITRYMHRPDDSPSPAVGARVSEGSTLGVIGATGLVDAAHLHMETWDKATGRRVNPALFFDFSRVVTAGASASINSTPFDPQEDDMYDQSARDELMRELEIIRPIKMYALVDDSGAGGWVWVGPSGRWWIVPSAAYAALVAAEGLSQSRPIRAIQQNEFDFMTKQLLGGLVPDSKTDYKPEAQLEHILTLDDASVQKIAASIGEIPVTLSPAQLDAIAAAVAGKTADEVKTAISSLSFVVKTS